MTRSSISCAAKAVLLLVLASFAGTEASAHVRLQYPNGGEQLVEGQTATVTWTILIAHNLQNWDLWYSTTSATGPWTVIAMDLPPGNPQAGSIHTYDWVLPQAAVADQVWVRVRMDNTGTDYFDVSDGSFTVSADCNADGVADFLGYGAGLAGSGNIVPSLSGSGCPSPGQAFSIDVSNGLGGASGVFFLGLLQVSVPAMGGTLLVLPVGQFPATLGGTAGMPGAGTGSLPLTLPNNPALIGTPLEFQGLFLDAGAVAGISFTQGLEVMMG